MNQRNENTQENNSDVTATLRSIFAMFCEGNSDKLTSAALKSLLRKIGKSEEEVLEVLLRFPTNTDQHGSEPTISFDEFFSALMQTEGPAFTILHEGADPKVIEFLRVLEEYRIKCETEGNYLEAGRAQTHLVTLRSQEEVRRQKAIRARQLAERQEVLRAHVMQADEFSGSWGKYMEEYDSLANMYIQQMTEKHATDLVNRQRELQEEIGNRPIKWSKELLEWRRRQHILAKQGNYTEAQRIKRVADTLEEKEREMYDEDNAVMFRRKEAHFRQQQESEKQTLLKRTDARRLEHLKQQEADAKRLAQRNRNVQVVLESKQSSESSKLFVDVKRQLMQATSTVNIARASTSSSSMAPSKDSETGSPISEDG